MSDIIARVVARARGSARLVHPLIPARFEPDHPTSLDALAQDDSEIEPVDDADPVPPHTPTPARRSWGTLIDRSSAPTPARRSDRPAHRAGDPTSSGRVADPQSEISRRQRSAGPPRSPRSAADAGPATAGEPSAPPPETIPAASRRAGSAAPDAAHTADRPPSPDGDSERPSSSDPARTPAARARFAAPAGEPVPNPADATSPPPAALPRSEPALPSADAGTGNAPAPGPVAHTTAVPLDTHRTAVDSGDRDRQPQQRAPVGHSAERSEGRHGPASDFPTGPDGARTAGDRDQAGGDSGSVVQVHIGRVDVRVIPATPPAERRRSRRRPALSLDDYLARFGDGA